LAASPINAADMGGQLKLKDDSKKELAEVMQSIKLALNDQKLVESSELFAYTNTNK